MKLDFWKTKSLYQLHSWQTEGLAKALKDLGAEVRYIDEESHHIREMLQRLWSDPPRQTLSFAPLSLRKDLKIDLPHLQVDSLLPAIPKESILSPSNQKGIVYFGSYRDHESVHRNLYREFSKGIIEKIEIALRKCLEGMPPEVAFEEEEDKLLGVDIESIYFLLRHLSKALSTKNMLQTFDSVAIYGSIDFPHVYQPVCKGSWKDWTRNHPSFSYHGPLAAKEVISTMSSYKLILDPTPAYKGVSLRLLQGLAAGSEVLTYQNPLVESYFGRGKGVSYVGEEVRSQNIKEGQAILRESFIWDVRAREILNALN